MPCNCPLKKRNVKDCAVCMAIKPERKKRPEASFVTRKPRPASTAQHQPLADCVYRGELAGKVNCGCQGAREVYRCTRLIRPSSALEPAFCVTYDLVKYVGIVLKDGSRLSKDQVPKDEIAVCQPGKCDLYKI